MFLHSYSSTLFTTGFCSTPSRWAVIPDSWPWAYFSRAEGLHYQLTLESTQRAAGSGTIMLGILRVGGLCRTSYWAVYLQRDIVTPAPTNPKIRVFLRQLVGTDHQPPSFTTAMYWLDTSWGPKDFISHSLDIRGIVPDPSRIWILPASSLSS